MEQNYTRKIVGTGAAFAFVGVALGAFGAHGLRDHISPSSMSVYQTGVQYHLIHAITLVAIAGIAERVATPSKIVLIVKLIAAGIVVFSGSLYLLAVTGFKLLGAITPIGGVCFLSAWALLCQAALTNKGSTDTGSG